MGSRPSHWLLALVLAFATPSWAGTDCSPEPSIVEHHEWGVLIRGYGNVTFNISAGYSLRMSDFAPYDDCFVMQQNGYSRQDDPNNYSTFYVDMWWGAGLFMYPNNPHLIIEDGFIIDWLDLDNGSTAYAEGDGLINHLFVEDTGWAIIQSQDPTNSVVVNISEGADNVHLIGAGAGACENGTFDPHEGPNFWQGAGWLDPEHVICSGF